jgi:hypothetical protein
MKHNILELLKADSELLILYNILEAARGYICARAFVFPALQLIIIWSAASFVNLASNVTIVFMKLYEKYM